MKNPPKTISSKVRNHAPVRIAVVVIYLVLSSLTSGYADGISEKQTANRYPHVPCIHVALLDSEFDTLYLGKKNYKNNKQLFRPITKEELANTLRYLQPMLAKPGTEWVVRSLVENRKVNLERSAVVLSDAYSMLAILQSKEVLTQLQKMPGVNKGEISWMAHSYTAIESCMKKRFGPWGGDTTYEKSLGIINTMRPEIESFLFDKVKFDSCSGPGCIPK